MSQRRLKTRVVTRADLYGSVFRGIDVMAVHPPEARAGSVTEQKGDDAFAVAG